MAIVDTKRQQKALGGFLATGVIIGAILFGARAPISILLSCYTAAFAWGMVAIRTSKLTLLPRAAIIAYTLPFTALIPLAFDESHTWWNSTRARSAVQNISLNEDVLRIGLLGLLALLLGMCAANMTTSRVTRSARSRRSLDLPVFAAGCCAAVILAYIGAPQQTILDVAYGQGEVVGAGLGFQGASLLSYVLLALLWVDSEQAGLHRGRRARRRRQLLVLGAAFTILVFVQLLRGNRDSVGVPMALAALWLTGPFTEPRIEGLLQRARSSIRARKAVVLMIGLALVTTFVAVGSLRASLSSSESAPSVSASVADGYRQATWKAVLLTNLSLAAQESAGSLERKWGTTYVDYVRSSVPGPVAKAGGFDRPINEQKGPAWEVHDISSGGIHLVVVPFLNFGPLGVVLVLATIGYGLARIDGSGAATTSMWMRLWYAATLVVVVRWFWYGDMVAVRGAMAVVIVGAGHSIASRPHPRTEARTSRSPGPSARIS
jgi:hypothetical protein